MAIDTLEISVGFVAQFPPVSNSFRVSVALFAQGTSIGYGPVLPHRLVPPDRFWVSQPLIHLMAYVAAYVHPLFSWNQRVTFSDAWLTLKFEFTGYTVRWWIDDGFRVPITGRMALGTVSIRTFV
jgi:hypothetical protein